MFKMCRIATAVVVGVFVVGIAAHAQVQPVRERPAVAARQQAGMQRMQQAQKLGQQSEAQAARWRQHPGLQVSLRGVIALPNPRVLQRVATALGLTEEQKEQIKQLYKQFAETTKPYREQRIEAAKAFVTAFRDPNVGKAELEALVEPVLQAERAIISAQLDFWVSLRGVLTPEQQTNLPAMIQRAGQEMRNRPVPGAQRPDKAAQ